MMPKEACGVVINDEFWPCKNVSETPTCDFELSAIDFCRLRLSKGKPQAIFHSHPKGGKESPFDQEVCSQLKIPFHIYLVPEDKWLIINP